MPSARPQRRKIRWIRLLLLLIIALALFTSLSWAAVYAYKNISFATVFNTTLFNPKVLSTKVDTKKVDTKKSSEQVGKYINILLMGVDDGDSGNPEEPRRSDTMIVASINPDNGKVNLLSIPRDTKVAIRGHKGFEKITHAFFYGGSNLAMRTVEDLLQIQIHHSVLIDWQAFIKTVDTLGGIDLYVENNMHYEDPYANLVINLSKGYQHLDGNQAGQYVRYRSDELGDISRVQRQQRFLKAFVEQTLQIVNIFKMPLFLNTVYQYVTIDMTGVEMVKLVYSLKSFKSGELHAEVLPGNFATIDGLSYWVYDKEQTRQLVERMFSADNTK